MSIATTITQKLVMRVVVATFAIWLLSAVNFGFSEARGQSEVKIYFPHGFEYPELIDEACSYITEDLQREIKRSVTGEQYFTMPASACAVRANQGAECLMRQNYDMIENPGFFSKTMPPKHLVGSYWSLLGHNEALILSAYDPTTHKLWRHAAWVGGVRGFYHPLRNVIRLGSPQAKLLIDPHVLAGEISPLSIVLVDSTENLVPVGHNEYHKGYLSKKMPQLCSNFEFPDKRKYFNSATYRGKYRACHFKNRRGMAINPVAEIAQVLAAPKVRSILSPKVIAGPALGALDFVTIADHGDEASVFIPLAIGSAIHSAGYTPHTAAAAVGFGVGRGLDWLTGNRVSAAFGTVGAWCCDTVSGTARSAWHLENRFDYGFTKAAASNCYYGSDSFWGW